MSVSRKDVYNKGGHILGPGDIVSVKFVTVIGYSNDFSVYQGGSDQTDDEIAMYGDKVSEDIGRAVAPYCEHLQYRA